MSTREAGDLQRALEAALAGGPRAPSPEDRGAGEAARPRAVARLRRPRVVRRGGAARQLGAGGPGRRRRGHRPGAGRRPQGGPDGQRPDREGGLLGAEDGGEDPPDPGAGAAPRGADGLPGGFGGRPDHRPGADVPGAPRRGADLLQRGRALRPGAPGLPAVRPVRRRRRLHPGLLRRGDHARGERLDVPGLAADGRDGDRREGDLEEMGGAKMHTSVSGCGHFLAQLGRGRDRPRQALPLLHAAELARGAAPAPPAEPASASAASPRSFPTTRTPPSTSRT